MKALPPDSCRERREFFLWASTLFCKTTLHPAKCDYSEYSMPLVKRICIFYEMYFNEFVSIFACILWGFSFFWKNCIFPLSWLFSIKSLCSALNVTIQNTQCLPWRAFRFTDIYTHRPKILEGVTYTLIHTDTHRYTITHWLKITEGPTYLEVVSIFWWWGSGWGFIKD